MYVCTGFSLNALEGAFIIFLGGGGGGGGMNVTFVVSKTDLCIRLATYVVEYTCTTQNWREAPCVLFVIICSEEQVMIDCIIAHCVSADLNIIIHNVLHWASVLCSSYPHPARLSR